MVKSHLIAKSATFKAESAELVNSLLERFMSSVTESFPGEEIELKNKIKINQTE